MPFATGSRHDMGCVAEVTFGTTPATPVFKRIRHTSSSLGLTKQVLNSNEIRTDRQIVDVRHGNKQVSGEIGFELSYGAFEDLMQSALCATWATNVLKAGTQVNSFTIERAFADISQYLQMVGCVVNTMSLRIAPNAIVTGTMGIIGKDMTVAGMSLDASGYDDAATNPPFDSFSGVLTEGGSAIATVTAVELNLDNGFQVAQVVGSAVAPQLLPGQSNLTGTITTYFQDVAMLNKFINETESSLQLTLSTAGTGKDYTILLPRIKYTGGDVPVQNAQDGVLLTMPFQALRDSTTATNIQITRVP